MDFDAQAGEILGIGGLLGSGRSELLLSIFGSEPIVEGEIKIDGETVKPDGPRSMMNSGVALLTEDRKVLGLLPELSIRENVTIASLRVGIPEGPAARTRTGGGRGQASGQPATARRFLRPAGVHAVRRQPAEGAARPLVADQTQGDHVRRTHQGHRRRRQGRALRRHQRSGPARAGRHRGLVVPARAARALPTASLCCATKRSPANFPAAPPKRTSCAWPVAAWLRSANRAGPPARNPGDSRTIPTSTQSSDQNIEKVTQCLSLSGASPSRPP